MPNVDKQVELFRTQARACGELGSPMYAELLERAADDLAAGGVTAEVLAGHEDDPGPSALALRLAGSVHRLVLERRAGEVMTPGPRTTATTALASEALGVMNARKITTLFAVDPDAPERPAGILHIHDLLRAGVA